MHAFGTLQSFIVSLSQAKNKFSSFYREPRIARSQNLDLGYLVERSLGYLVYLFEGDVPFLRVSSFVVST